MKYYLVKEDNSENLVVVGANGFKPAGAISEVPVDEDGKPLPAEALEEVEAVDQDGEPILDVEGSPVKVWEPNQQKLTKHKSDKKAILDKAEDDEKKAKKARKDAKDKVKGINWAQVNTIGELKEIVKDIFEMVKD